MRVTIAQLQERIKYLEEQKNSWYQKYQELKDEDDRRKRDERIRFEVEQNHTDKQITNLMEIIRWQIRPNTAESPFMPTKNEREENPIRRNY